MALGSYQQVQFGDLANRLSARLGDPVPVNGPVVGFWSAREIRRLLQESLRTWQAFSAFFSTRVSFGTSAGTLFYELGANVPELSYTVTDRDLIQDISYYLQEPYSDGSEWTGKQFTIGAITTAIQQRRDRFKVESGLGLSQAIYDYTGGPGGVFEMPDNIVDVRRVMWQDAAGKFSVLWKADQWTLSTGAPGWFTNPGLPTDYSTVLQQPLALQLAPPPSDIGRVHIISLNSSTNLDPLAASTILNLPDDLTWVVKFGALADLFGEDGIGKDPERAAYCEERWRDGIQLARIYNSVRLGYLEGVPVLLDAMEELDQAIPNWVSGTPGTPQSLVSLGSVVAVHPIADANPHSISFDITPKFPIPQSDQDWVQIGQEYLDIIVDYAEHLANVKVGADEIKECYGLYKNFASQAALMNDRLRAQANNFDVLSDRSRQSEKINPRRRSDVGRKELSYEND